MTSRPFPTQTLVWKELTFPKPVTLERLKAVLAPYQDLFSSICFCYKTEAGKNLMTRLQVKMHILPDVEQVLKRHRIPYAIKGDVEERVLSPSPFSVLLEPYSKNNEEETA